jgi:hypothetical protein
MHQESDLPRAVCNKFEEKRMSAFMQRQNKASAAILHDDQAWRDIADTHTQQTGEGGTRRSREEQQLTPEVDQMDGDCREVEAVANSSCDFGTPNFSLASRAPSKTAHHAKRQDLTPLTCPVETAPLSASCKGWLRCAESGCRSMDLSVLPCHGHSKCGVH